MKFLSIVFLFIIIPSKHYGAQDLAQLVKKVSGGVGLVLGINKKNVKYGSGYFINSDGDFVTNWHVISGLDKMAVKFKDGKIYLLDKVVAIDKEKDIAILRLKINSDKICFLKMARSLPELGSRLFVLGNPMGFEQTVSDGIVSSIRNYKGNTLIQMTAPISQGSSGGPVMNMKGDVIGISTLIMTEGQNLNFAVSTKKVIELLNKSGNYYVTNYQETVDLAKKCYYEGDLVGAKKYIYSALQIDSNATSLYKVLIEALDKKDTRKYLYLLLENISEVYPNKFSRYAFECACYVLGKELTLEKKFDEAIIYYERVELPFSTDYKGFSKKASSMFYFFYAYTCYKLNRLEDAIKWYNYYLAGASLGEKLDYQVYTNLGIACFKLKRYKDSVEFLKKALALTDRVEDGVMRRSHVLGLVAMAKFKILEPRIAWLKKKGGKSSINKLKSIFLKEKKYIRDRLKEAVRIWPENRLAWMFLGKYYFYVGNLDTSKKIFSRLLKSSLVEKDKKECENFIGLIDRRLN